MACKKKEAILKELQTSSKGLTDKEASLRLETYGKNMIEEVYKIKPMKIFFKQFKSFLIYILLVATLFSIIIKHFLDASVIFLIVLLNATIGFFQQYKAEKSIAELKKILVPNVRVIRNSKLKKISSLNLVPGDIIVLREGDKIMADSRILKAENLEVNEAILTGESLPVEKFDSVLQPKTEIPERKNMLYTGTSIVKGNVKAIVVATGMQTEFGKIAGMLQKIKIKETPMQKRLDRFAKQIGIFILVISFILAVIGILSGFDKIEMALMAIALAVSAVPEGLPAVITIGLAFATKKMLRNDVIVRKLPAAETLGSVTLIATDKTGTITEEKMSVRGIFCNNKFFEKKNSALFTTKRFAGKKEIKLENEKEFLQLIKTSVLCNNARFEKREARKNSGERYEILGDPTEAAFVMAALDLGINKKMLAEQEPRIKEASFSSERKMMSVLREGERRNTLYAKGASNVVLEKSSFEFVNGRIERLTEKRKKQLLKIAEKMEAKALRVLAFSFRNISKKIKVDIKDEKGIQNLESAMIFLGFIGMLDPPREEARSAIELCKKAGIKVKMITGDSALTARAIAKDVGIEGYIITGTELDDMNDETLKRKINDIAIFARITPKQKLRIVQILKIKGENVAITGDGVNDVLALRKADIGIAMGRRGSDVARDVADMVLIDDNFASIVKAVEEGRIVYDNTKKSVKFLLASNFGEILIVTYSILAMGKLALLPLQILWINLVTDSIPALALTKEKGESVMKSKPRKERSVLDNIIWFIVAASIISLITSILVFHYALKNFSIEKTRTIVMTTIIMFEAFFVFTCRTKENLLKTGVFSNKWVVYAFFSVIVLQIILLYTPLRLSLSLVPLSLDDWLFILPFSLSGLVVFEIWKYFKKKED